MFKLLTSLTNNVFGLIFTIIFFPIIVLLLIGALIATGIAACVGSKNSLNPPSTTLEMDTEMLDDFNTKLATQLHLDDNQLNKADKIMQDMQKLVELKNEHHSKGAQKELKKEIKQEIKELKKEVKSQLSKEDRRLIKTELTKKLKEEFKHYNQNQKSVLFAKRQKQTANRPPQGENSLTLSKQKIG